MMTDRDRVSRADIVYDTPVTRSEAGLPIGNGRMGSLVWTTPETLRFQINRVDVFSCNSSTSSFPRAGSDYANGCAFVDINFVDFGDTVFYGEAFRQNLSVYDAIQTIQGLGVTLRIFACHDCDVFVVEIDDRRERPQPIAIDLRMLRSMIQWHPGKNYELAQRHAIEIQTGAHTGTSTLSIHNGRIALTQVFCEGDHYNASNVAVSLLGRESQARYVNENTVRLSVAPGKGVFTILIASAATFDRDQEIAALSLETLDAAEAKGVSALRTEHQNWWHEFWSKSFVQLHSADGVAEFVEQHYTYFLYLMASSSRGAYTPRYGGMLWVTTGDMRQWGSEHWWHNSSCYYEGLMPANRFELFEPVYAMYDGMRDACALAARQQWGSEGIWIPETHFFDGAETLPDDIADEMQDLYLMRKPWESRSERFQWYSENKQTFNSRWNWINHVNTQWEMGHFEIMDKEAGPFGHVTHIFTTTSKIAYLYWLRYEYTRDTAFLRERAYLMLRGVVEFYRNFPNTKKGDDAHYHITHTNHHEELWDAQDTLEDLAALVGITPILLRASEILDTDSEMRPIWREFLDYLPPLPTGASGEWVRSAYPCVIGHSDSIDTVPAVLYDLCTVATRDAAMRAAGQATFDALFKNGVHAKTPVHTLDRSAVAAAFLGRADAIKHMLPNQLKILTPERDFCDWEGIGEVDVLPNRLTLREGAGCQDAQRIGRMTAALHAALLQSVPSAPGGDATIHLFPAWPLEWDADYTLVARGAFLVSASIEQGRIGSVKIQSQLGGTCRLQNPWPNFTCLLTRNGKQSELITGTLLEFDTDTSETVMVNPQR